MTRTSTFHSRLAYIIGNIDYKDWGFVVGSRHDYFYLQVQFTAKCRDSQIEKKQHGRKWSLSKHMTDSEIVQTALRAVLCAEEHEAREAFEYRGKPIFGPHYNVDVLAAICNDPDAFDTREEWL